ncbi:MAG TPA: GxxExxY protein [Pirellulales bacterium]|nr:GxxExxY protein [Pirellulales bacterium]
MERELLYKEITEAIIVAAFEVHNVLGYGFLERVYQRAMQVELLARGLKAEIENQIVVRYKGMEVGLYKADLWVNDCVIVELKVAKSYCSDEPQLLNELKATGVKVGLLINFGRYKIEFKRFVF